MTFIELFFYSSRIQEIDIKLDSAKVRWTKQTPTNFTDNANIKKAT